MTTATATLTEIPAEIGTWQILCDGQPYGPTWTWQDVAAEHVTTCRRLFPTSAWELTDAKTGERIACDETEAAFLHSQEQYEAREAAEGWTPRPAACAYCDGEVGSLDTLDDFRFLAVNDPACIGCLQGLAASHDFGQYAAA